MKLPKYELRAEETFMVFEFVSEGAKGRIDKIIKFSETSTTGFFNLAFGDKCHITGDIDDMIVSNNDDSDQVLATVVSAVFIFTEHRKNIWVYATGSTKSRTRLYRIGISKYLNEIEQDFHIFGLLDGEWEKFKKEVDYTAFVVKRK